MRLALPGRLRVTGASPLRGTSRSMRCCGMCLGGTRHHRQRACRRQRHARDTVRRRRHRRTMDAHPHHPPGVPRQDPGLAQIPIPTVTIRLVRSPHRDPSRNPFNLRITRPQNQASPKPAGHQAKRWFGKRRPRQLQPTNTSAHGQRSAESAGRAD